MPSFQYAAQLPYPVSEYESKYNPFNYAFGSEHYGTHQSYGQIGPQDLGFGFTESYDRYRHTVQPMTAFDLSQSYANTSTNLPLPVGAPMLPPLRIDERYMSNPSQQYSQRQYRDRVHYEPQQKEEKPVGGVSAKLDYDMEQMIDFVAEMTIGIIKPAFAVQPTFRKWVGQVLNATRLPSATILLSLSYLTIRLRGLYASGSFVPQERTVYKLLTVALILGSKFLDDNTFQNKSWAEVSNIPVVELNRDERDWLAAFDHRLHHDAKTADGFTTWEEQWVAFKARAISATASMLAADAELRHQQSLRQAFSPVHFPQQRFARSNVPCAVEMSDVNYSSPTYSPYDGWTSHGQGHDSSPSSASQTGPNTPDFYAAQNGWASFEPFTARHMNCGFASLPLHKSGLSANNVTCPDQSYNLPSNALWNCHSSACQCNICRAQSNYLQPRYEPIVVG